MKETTLVHIIRDGCVLMMHRISKQNDINHGKWIGVGGKFKKGETPEECMRREVREETGLRIDQYRYCGIVTFVSDDDDMEYMHLFTVTGFHDCRGNRVKDGRSFGCVNLMGGGASDSDPDAASGGVSAGCADIELKKCDEGQLEWIPKERLNSIPHWAGDSIFLPLILDMEIPFFSMKLVYRNGDLIHASLNEHNCLVTDRLILRPWLIQDAAALYGHVKNPDIGPRAGWLPHTDITQSRSTIQDILSRPEIYAIVLRGTAEPIGSVGLQSFRLADKDGSCYSYFDERQSVNRLVCTMPEEADFEDAPGEAAGSEISSCAAGHKSPEPGSFCAAGHKPPEPGSFCADKGGYSGSALPEQLYVGLSVEASLGYWLAEPYWHQGYMTEAAGAVLEHAFRDLGIRRVWADYYEGNEASANVMKRLGLHFHHIEKDRYVAPLKEKRTAVVYVTEEMRHEKDPDC